jgi:hypothetical protein
VNGGVCAKAADTNSADEINAVAAPTAPREKMRVRVIFFSLPSSLFFYRRSDLAETKSLPRIYRLTIIYSSYRTTIIAELLAIDAVLARPVSTKSGVPTT